MEWIELRVSVVNLVELYQFLPLAQLPEILAIAKRVVVMFSTLLFSENLILLEQAESRFQEASTKSEGASKPTEESEKYNIPFNPIPPPNNSFTSLFENNRSFLDTLIIPVFLIK
jgi:hypothetical protein